jgi:hypothetical protein
MIRIKHRLLLFFLAVAISAYTQENTVSSGGEANGNGGSFSYSIGQVFYSINTGNTGVTSQGVQQAYEIYPVGISELDINMFTLYPNPTTDKIIIKKNNAKTQLYSYLLEDINGSILAKGSLQDIETQIDLSLFASSVYTIQLINAQNLSVINYKIIKK